MGRALCPKTVKVLETAELFKNRVLIWTVCLIYNSRTIESLGAKSCRPRQHLGQRYGQPHTQ